MAANLPVLVACRHKPEYLAAAKKKIDQYFDEGRNVLAIELYPLQDSPFFGTLKRYAESKGMTVIPIDSTFGGKKTDKLIDSIDFAEEFAKRVPGNKKEEYRYIQKANYRIFEIANKRTQVMIKKLKRILPQHPDLLIIVDFVHGNGIRKEIPVKYDKVGRKPIARILQAKYVAWHREKAKAKAKKRWKIRK